MGKAPDGILPGFSVKPGSSELSGASGILLSGHHISLGYFSKSGTETSRLTLAPPNPPPFYFIKREILEHSKVTI